MKTKLTSLDNGSRTSAMTEPAPGRKSVLAGLLRRLCAAVLVLPAFGTQAGVVFTSLHLFQASPNGKYPAGLVQGSDGNFYGTTINGGLNNNGTMFKISTNGALTTLHLFTGGNDGAQPHGLAQSSDGSFYGITGNGGLYKNGTVFKISTNGALTSLYSFTDSGIGGVGLVQGSDGNFYGTSSSGGTNGGFGTVFKISTNGELTSLYSGNKAPQSRTGFRQKKSRRQPLNWTTLQARPGQPRRWRQR